MSDEWKEEKWIRNFFVTAEDPGYLYILENHGIYKIGKTKNRLERMRAAKTWMPDVKVIGFKPFWGVSEKERILHVAMSVSWYDGEWFKPFDEGYLNVITEEFQEFSDADINKNSVDFVYWINGSGMAEVIAAQNDMRKPIRQFQRDETEMRKKEEE